MSDFKFIEKPSFIISQKYQFYYSDYQKNIVVKSGLLNTKTEFEIKFEDKKGFIKIKNNKFSYTIYKGFLDNKDIEIKQTNKEIHLNYEDTNYEFVFQKDLITGLFVKEINVGIIKQVASVQFGLENYYGFISSSIPQEVLVLFLVLFNRIFSKDGYLFYTYKGFVSIEPRLMCTESIIEKLNHIENKD